MAEETNVPQDGVNELSQESTFLAPASIGANLYEPAASPMFDINNLPGKANVSNAAYRVKDITTGSAPNYPNKVVSPKSKKFSFAQGLADELDVVFANNVDNNAYNKLYAYDSSPKGAHKARYKAYGQKTYDRIGFSPEIDNETWFNQNTTMYDDWKRMATQAAWPMMKLGFMSPIKSYGKLMGGADIGQDIEEARDYEEYNAIGMSTKGGVGGFLVNLQNSAAYSVGILTEGVVEGALIGGAIGAIGGEGVGAIPGAAFGGILEGFETLAKLPASLINMSKNLGKMTMNLKKLQNISEVRNVFNKTGRAMGNFINPLSNTSEAAMKYVFNNPDDLSNLARSARTVGAMWHDVKNMNLALSEGRLEGGFTENKVYDELYNKYYEKYNVAPNDDLQKSMREQAKVAGFQNTFKNTLLVHYSNNIAFPSITRAGFLKGVPRFSETIGRIGSEYNLIFNPGKTVAEGLYTAEKVSLRNAAKALTKPATYGKTALNYFKANFVEGFQETAQDVLSDATERYYVDSFKNKDRQNFEYSMATLNAAMKKQISAQGLETFASGFAMGSILSIPGGVKDFLSVGYNKYFKYRGNYDQHIKERGEEATKIADALNDMHKNGQNFFDPRLNNYTTQMLVGKVADDPDGNSTKESKDASFTGFFSSVHTALRSGTFDLFIKNFEGYKQATPEELEQAWKLEPGQGAKALLNIDSAITSAKKTAERYQYAKKKFTNVLNPNDFAENTPEREKAEIYNQAYLEGIHNLTFMGAAFDNNAERLSSMYNKLSSIPTLQNSRFSDIALLTEPERLGKEINMLRTEVKLGEQAVTPEAKTLYKEQKQLLDTLESYQKEQAGATVEFTEKLITATLDIIMANPNIAPNEARAKAVDQIEEEYKKAGLNPFVNYKNSFKSVLNTLAGSEENINTLDRQLDEKGGLDDLFETLMDTHILRNENNNLNKYINILNSPKSFYEHVQRNFDWMQKLYNNREDYYNDIINNSLINIQRNTLLEELAEDGIYVDLEEFAQWCEDKTPPSYFIDQVNKRIINKDSYLYDKYMEMFDAAEDAEVTNPPMPKSDADKKMQMQVDTLNEQREAALEKEKLVYDKDLKEVLGYTQDEIDEQRNIATFDNEMDADDLVAKIDLVKRSIEQLDSSNPIEIEAVVDLVDEESLLTPNEVNSAKEDIYGNEDMMTQIAALSEMFTDLSEEEAFETAANALIFKDLLIKRLETLENQSTDALAGIPEYEGTQPYTEYNKSVETINTKFDRLIEEAIFNFRKAQREDVDSNRPEAMKKSIKQVKDLFDTKGDIVQTKRNYIVEGEPNERMSNRIKSGYDTYTYTGSQALSDLFDKTIGVTLTAGKALTQDVIDNFIVALEEANLPGVNSNKFTIPTVKDELETLIAPEGTRLSKKTQDYIGKLETQIEEVNTKLATVKNKKREAILNKQKAALQKAIEDEQSGVYNEKFDMTIENIKSFVANTVKENAYQESRDGGDLIDPMLKAYLDTATSVKPAFDPKLMTKDAYDALFDDETGYLTNLKRMADAGEIYIFTKNLFVHSDNLVDAEGNKLPPVAGEIDMIIVDTKGNKFIVDLKTGKQDKWNYYKVLNSKSYQKQLENTLQQTGYANLAQNMLGEEFGIKILPIEVAYDKDGKLISAGKPSNLVLFSDEEVIGNEGTEPYTISLDSSNTIQAKNPETGFTENISIADLMQRLVPNLNNKTAVKGKTVKNKESVPENEQALVDSFIIKMNESENMFDSFEELDTLKPNLSKASYNMLKNLIDEKVNSMLNGISENVLKSGEIYIFTKALKSMKIPQGYKVILNSIDFESGNVELSRVGPGRKKDITMSITDFNNAAVLEESLSDTPTGAEEYVLTEGETENINDSMDTINNELGDPNQLIKWKEEAAADNITADELEDDFFTNFKC